MAQEAGGGAQKCRVDVLRTGAGGTASVTRAVLSNGECVCAVTTGAANANGSAESVVQALLRDRECEGAPAPGDQASNAGGGGGSGAVLGGIIGAAAIAGLAAGLGGSDSPG